MRRKWREENVWIRLHDTASSWQWQVQRQRQWIWDNIVPRLVLIQYYPTSFIASIFHDPARALESEKIMETA
jgi:hypothetical protein